MLTVATTDIKELFEGQPLLQSPIDYPPPGGFNSDDCSDSEEEAGDAS